MQRPPHVQLLPFMHVQAANGRKADQSGIFVKYSGTSTLEHLH